jgi:phenylacetate-CoA ligase
VTSTEERAVAGDSPYWNPKYETAPRETLRKLQLAKWQRLVAYADERSPFYRHKFRAAGFEPSQLQSLDDVRRIPLTTKEEWLASQAESPLFGDLVTAPEHVATRYHLTSGTSGRVPLRVLDSTRDWAWISEIWAYGLWGFGVRPTDVVYFAFSYASFIGFWGAHYASEKIGALTVASGNLPTETRVRQIMELGVTTVCATPTYALRLGAVARGMGIDLATESKIDKVVLGGEPGANIPATRRLITEALGGRCGDFAGMTEIGTNMVVECADAPGGPHIVEDHIYEEVVNPTTGEPAAYGERGERIVTSFGRGLLPLIRYRASDLVERVPHTDCTCGRTFDLYKGGILGRVDDMKVIRGTNVFPSAVEAIVREYAEVEEFQIELASLNGRDEITLKVELDDRARDGGSDLCTRLGKDLAESHEGLRFIVSVADPGSLPRFELKARRLVDLRAQGVGA